MSEPFTFYRAFEPTRGSWDGYGYFSLPGSDFLAYVADSPSGASIHTPELIHEFWAEFSRKGSVTNPLELADGINRLQVLLQTRSKQEGGIYQSTLALACKTGRILHYFSLGDSTLEIFRDNRLYRLSESDVWDGAIILDAATRWIERTKTGPLQFVGNGGQFIPASRISQFELLPADLLVLHTDGFEDLIAPDRVIRILQMKPEERRAELEHTFQKERLKDDVTLLVAEILVPPSFEAEKQISAFQSEILGLRKDQQDLRADLSRIVLTQKRFEKMEHGIQELGRQIQQLVQKVDARKVIPAAGPVSITRKSESINIRWYWLLIAFLAGAAIVFALFFVQTERKKAVAIPEPAVPPAIEPQKERPVVAPPEIPENEECDYVVQKGDSLQKIAQKRNLTVEQLLEWNPTLQRDNALQIGAKLSLCGELP